MTLPSDASLSTLSQLGESLYKAEQTVLDLEARLKAAKRQRDYIAQQAIPEFLAENDIESISLTGGRRIDVKPILSVTPLAANRPLVYAEVEAKGDGNLIKRTVTVPLGKGEDEKLKQLLASLQEQGLDAKVDTKIEPSTLKKWVRNRLEKGLPVDKKLFGVRDFSRAEFTEGAPKVEHFEGE